MLSTPEFNKTRELLEKRGITKITDYGEKAFNVKIETISFITSKKRNIDFLKTEPLKDVIKIESYITNTVEYKNSDYVFSKNFPYWLIYRNKLLPPLRMELYCTWKLEGVGGVIVITPIAYGTLLHMELWVVYRYVYIVFIHTYTYYENKHYNNT